MRIDNTIPEIARRQIEHIAEVCERIKPLVVIHCITYNHEAFLKDALEGFLMQKTDFPFVAVVHDDASTDGTAAVLREYAERYPDIILPIFEEENQYSKRDRTISRVMKSAKLATGAKYVAMCEGDDYWTYEYKLQKQVDFLESHPDYSLVFHNAKTKLLDGNLVDDNFKITGTRNYSATEILKKWTIPTASVVYRREIIDDSPLRFHKNFRYGDNVLFLIAAKYGALYGFDEYMSIYRRHEGSVTASAGAIHWAEINIEHYKAIAEVFHSLLEEDFVTYRYCYLLKVCRNHKSYKKYFFHLIRAVNDCGFVIIKSELKYFVEKVRKRIMKNKIR